MSLSALLLLGHWLLEGRASEAGTWYVLEEGEDACEAVFKYMEPRYHPGCPRMRRNFRLRRENGSAMKMKVSNVRSALRDEIVSLITLSRTYRFSDLKQGMLELKLGQKTYLDERAEAVQFMYQEERDETTGRFYFGSDLLFQINRNFTEFPRLPSRWHFMGRRVGPMGPPDVYILILDSASRRNMNRFAPKVVSLFEREWPHHKSFLFPSFHTICGGGTLGTIYPMFHGGVGVRTTPSWCSDGVKENVSWKMNYSALEPCYDPKRRILKLAREAGFVVGLSTNLLVQLYNDLDDPHHATNPAICNTSCTHDEDCLNSYDMAYDIAKCSDQTCFGKDRYAKKILSFNDELFATFSDHPKFLLSMLHGAHATPQALDPLQSDLYPHLLSAVSTSSNYQNSVVIVMGDHGFKPVSCDYTSPFLGVFVPHTHPEMADAVAAMRTNSDLSRGGMLITPWDLYATLRHVISMGHQTTQSEDHFGLQEIAHYGEIQSHSEIHGRNFIVHASEELQDLTEHAAFGRFSLQGPFSPRSLFSKMNAERTCEEAGIAGPHCTQGETRSRLHNCSALVRSRFRDRAAFGEGAPMSDRQVLQTLMVNFPQVFKAGNELLILSFVDADSDGYLRSAEVLPVLEAGLLNSDVSSFWCAASTLRVLQAVETMNWAYTRQSQGACQEFTLDLVESVFVSEGDSVQSLSIRFAVSQGEPRSRYEVTFSGRAKDAGAKSLWKTGQVVALTRYHKYQTCTPKGFEPEFCVCDGAL